MRGLIGYDVYTVDKKEQLRLLNLLLQYGIVIYGEREKEETVTFRVPLFDTRRTEEVLRTAGIGYKKGGRGGIAGLGQKLLHHPGLLVGFFLSLLLYIWLSGMVWEVRVTADTDIDEDRVLSVLAECGLTEGKRLRDLDPDALASSYLLRDSSAAFATVHLRGVVAEVELIPKKDGEDTQNTAPPCNVVASRDALITDMTVYSGTAAVKIGQTVAAGDILVSGIITDVGGTRILGAHADVRGQVEEDVVVTVPFATEREQVVSRKTREISLTVFGRTFTFGDEGEHPVTERKQLYLFGCVRLPVSVELRTETRTELREQVYGEAETARMAAAELRLRVANTVGDGTLISRTCAEGIEGDAYVMRCHLVYETNIAKLLAFEVENQ